MDTLRFVPKIIHIDLTGKCNFNCLHCRGMPTNKEIDKNKLLNILDQMHSIWENSIEWFELGGGEPLLYSDLNKTIEYIKQKFHAKILIVTNGYFASETNIKNLIHSGLDRIQFSLDGTDAETHDWLRNYKGSYDKVIAATKICKSQNLDFVLRMTINLKNKNQIEDYFKLAKELGAVEIGLRGCIYVGNAETFDSSLYIDKIEYAKILENLPILSKKYNMPYFSGDPLSLIANKELIRNIEKTYGTINLYAGCSTGISYLFINNDAKVAFCPMLNEVIIGDPIAENLKQIWDTSKIFNKMRNRELDGKCGSCKFTKLCGGCCAYGYWKEKRLFAQNPICTLYSQSEGGT